MNTIRWWMRWLVLGSIFILAVGSLWSQSKPVSVPGDPKSSYDQITPVLLGQETFEGMMAKDKAAKD
jgi:hypothetical protein